jgi:hypothetical protein
MGDTGWDQPFKEAIEAVQRRDFDEVKKALETLEFQCRQTKDPNHWLYFHPLLRGDPIFRYPRNLYRPHGRNREANKISKRDQAQARQIIDVLRAVVESQQCGEGDDQ